MADGVDLNVTLEERVDYLGVAGFDGRDENGVAFLVARVEVGAALEQAEHDVDVAVARGHTQRTVAVLVHVIDVDHGELGQVEGHVHSAVLTADEQRRHVVLFD